MAELFLRVLEMSLRGSVVILAVILLRLLLKKVPKSVFCLLWLLAGLGLMLPLEIESSFSLQPRLGPIELDQTVVIQVPDDIPASAPAVHTTGTEQPEAVKPEVEKTPGRTFLSLITGRVPATSMKSSTEKSDRCTTVISVPASGYWVSQSSAVSAC